MDKVIKNKRDLELVPSRSSGYETILLSNQVWWCNIKWLMSYFKNCFCKFMQASSWNHKLFHFHLSFCIWKVWKVSEKITKVWLENEKSFFNEIKNTFHSFWRAIIWWKNKNLIKNGGHGLTQPHIITLKIQFCYGEIPDDEGSVPPSNFDSELPDILVTCICLTFLVSCLIHWLYCLVRLGSYCSGSISNGEESITPPNFVVNLTC